MHQDIALSNVFTRDGEVTALLDFELVGADARVCDPVAVLVNAGCLEDAADPLARATALLRGYGQRVRLTADEPAALLTQLRFRSAGGVVWKYGRYLFGCTDRATNRWVDEHGDALVAAATDACGGG